MGLSSRQLARAIPRWIFAVYVLTGLILAGCSVNGRSRELRTQEWGGPLRLAFITCAVEARFFEPVKKGMSDAAKMMGVECDFLGTEGVDVAAQAKMVRQAVADGYNGIALNIIDKSNVEQVIELTEEKYR